MVTPWTCKFWLEFRVCAREIPFPAENADFPAGIGVSHSSEGNASSPCPLDRKEKWEIEAWEGCWEWFGCVTVWDFLMGKTPRVPLVPTAHPGNALSSFSCLFHSTRTIFLAKSFLGNGFFQGKPAGNWKALQVIPLNFNCSLCRKIKEFSPLLSLAAPSEEIPTVFPGLTPKIPPWMCPGPCAGIISLGFSCSTGDPWSREHQALFRIPNVPFPPWNREFLG